MVGWCSPPRLPLCRCAVTVGSDCGCARGRGSTSADCIGRQGAVTRFDALRGDVLMVRGGGHVAVQVMCSWAMMWDAPINMTLAAVAPKVTVTPRRL